MKGSLWTGPRTVCAQLPCPPSSRLASMRMFTRSFPLPWRAMPQHADATQTETRQTKNSTYMRVSSGAPKCTERGFFGAFSTSSEFPWWVLHYSWYQGQRKNYLCLHGSGIRVIGDTEWVFFMPGSCMHSTDYRQNHVRTVREYTVFLPSLLMPCSACTEHIEYINYYKWDELRYMGNSHRSYTNNRPFSRGNMSIPRSLPPWIHGYKQNNKWYSLFEGGGVRGKIKAVRCISCNIGSSFRQMVQEGLWDKEHEWNL